MTPTIPARVRDFPWPFSTDHYRYSANVEPAPGRRVNASGSWGDRIVDVTDEYLDEVNEKRFVLDHDRSRLGALPHMRSAAWEATDWILTQTAADSPEHFAYGRSGLQRSWRNSLTNEAQIFELGNEDSLPCSPMEFAARQVQEDIVLLDQREDDLFADAGVVTFASNWSLDFDLGMSFLEVHGPVPLDYAQGAMPRALQFLLRMTDGTAYRRTNWTSTIGHRLDLSLEEYSNWGVEREYFDQARLGELFNLRVEVQHLIRLPLSNTILFLIHTYLAPLQDIVQVPGWSAQFQSVLENAPNEMIAYKSLTTLRPALIDYLSEHATRSNTSATTPNTGNKGRIA